MDLQRLVRPNIWNLEPYSSARNEFTGSASVFLDANENPFNSPYNRYPDPLQREVKELIAGIRKVPADRIFLGVGSDECIDLAYRIFCEPGIDNVVAIAPTYGMYQVCADINNVEYRRVALTDDFGLDTEALLAATDAHTKLLWICSPNNPTGNAFATDDILRLCRRFEGMVIVDEAYIDFSGQDSMLGHIDTVPNLIVFQTLSKAWGSAAVRLGIAFASQPVIDIYNKVKYPYNVNALTQRYAIDRLRRHNEVEEWVATLLANRSTLIDALAKMSCVRNIFGTDANFVLVRVDDADALYRFLRDRGIIVRNRNRMEKCLGCLRITVGTADENEQLIKNISEYEQRQ